jgi:flagellar hook assembly protein FlgD
MLTQMSEIGQLESSTNLQSSLTTMVQQNQIASAANMIGKYAQGTDQNSNQTAGTITAVQVTTNGVNLSMDNGDTMPLNNVTAITDSPPAAATTPSSSTVPGSA